MTSLSWGRELSGSGDVTSLSSGSIVFSEESSSSIWSSSFSRTLIPFNVGVSGTSSPSPAGLWLPSLGSSLSSCSLGQLGTGEGSVGYSWEALGVSSLSFTMSTRGFLVQFFKCSQKSDHLKNSAQHFSHTWVSSLPLRLSFPLSASSSTSPRANGAEEVRGWVEKRQEGGESKK